MTMTQRIEDNRSNREGHRNNTGEKHLVNTDGMIRPLLKALGRCHDVRIACKLMEQMHRALHDCSIDGVVISLKNENIDDLSLVVHPEDRDATKRMRISLPVAKSIFRCNGFAVLLVALQHFAAQATAITCWTCRIFTTVTCVIPMASCHLIELGGLRTLMNEERHNEQTKSYYTHSNMGRAASITMRLEYIWKANMVGLLHNLITNVEYESHGKDVATVGCLNFVIAVLLTYPANAHVQEWGIRYLSTVGVVGNSKVKAFLQKKRVENVFISALHHFRYHDSNVNKVAREALQSYASS